MLLTNRLWIPLALSIALASRFPTDSRAQGTVELAGHEQAVAAVSFTPDAKTLATGSFDRRIKLWDVASKQEIRTLDGHTDMVLALGFTPDGKRLLSGGRDKFLRIWNLFAGEPTRTLPPLPADVVQIDLTPDNKSLVIGSADGLLRAIDLASGNSAAERAAHEGSISAFAISPDGQSVWTIGADKNLRGWALPNLDPLGTPLSFETPQNAITISSDGTTSVVGDAAGNLRGIRLPTGAIRNLQGHTGDVQRLVRTGTSLVSLSSDQTVHVHSTADDSHRSIAQPSPVRDIAVSSVDPNLIATVSEDRAIRIWGLANGELVATRDELPDVPTAVSFRPDAKALLVGEASGAIRMLPYPFVREVQERAVDAHNARLTALSKSADGATILTASEDKTVHLWDANGSPIRAFALFAPVKHAVLSPAGDRLAAVGADNIARVWASNGTEQKVIPNVAGPVAFSADGKWFATAGPDNKVYLHPADFSADPKPVATHGGPIRAILFTPASNLLISAAQDNAIKVADLATATELKTLAGHGAPVTALAIAADGKKLVSGSEDKTARVWDVEAGTQFASLTESAAPILSVAISDDGNSILTGAADNQVRVYRAGQWKLNAPCPSPSGVAFGANSKTFLAAGEDNRLRFISEKDPQIVGRIVQPVRTVTSSPDGATIFAASDDPLIQSFEVATGNPVRGFAHGGAVGQMAISPNGSRLVSAEASGKVRIWDIATGDAAGLVDVARPVTGLALSDDAERFAIVTQDHSVIVYRLDGSKLEEFNFPKAQIVEFAPDSQTLALAGVEGTLALRPSSVIWSTNQGGPIVSLLRLPEQQFIAVSSNNQTAIRGNMDGATVHKLDTPTPVAATVSPDGTRLAVASQDQKVRLHQLPSGEVWEECPAMPAQIAHLRFQSNGSELVMVSADGSMTLWSVRTPDRAGATLATLKLPGPATSIALASENQTILTSSQDRVIRFFDRPPPPMIELAGHDGPIFGLAVQKDRQFAATASGDHSVILWKLDEAKSLHRLIGHSGQVYSVAFQPNGKLLASASHDGKVILWDIENGTETRRLEISKWPLFQVAFTPDGKSVVAAGADRNVHLWDVETAVQTSALEGHPDEIYGLSVQAEGTRIATSGYGGHVIVWDTAEGKAVLQQQFSTPTFGVAIRSDGAQIAVGTSEGKSFLVEIPAKN